MGLDGLNFQRDCELASEGLLFRPIQWSDAPWLLRYAGDERVAFSSRMIPHPLNRADVDAYIARAAAGRDGETVWIIDGTTRGMPTVLGVVSLTLIHRGQGEIGYWVAPMFWNEGIATAAVGAMVEQNPLRLRTYFAEVFQDNPNSAKVLVRHGFGYLGEAETHSLARGTNVPTWTYLRNLV